MKWSNGIKIYNTETGILKKMVVETEDLGEGFTRYCTRSLYLKKDNGEHFLHVSHITTDRKDVIFDKQEWIVTVTDEWARMFNKTTPELYPNI